MSRYLHEATQHGAMKCLWFRLGLAVVIFVSCQTGFSAHSRYIIPGVAVLFCVDQQSRPSVWNVSIYAVAARVCFNRRRGDDLVGRQQFNYLSPQLVVFQRVDFSIVDSRGYVVSKAFT